MRHPSPAALWSLVLVALPACAFAPEDAQRLERPPQVYREWFTRTQQCSGLRGDFSRLEFFVVEGESFACPTGRCSGRWEPPGRIYVARRYVEHEMVVRHEMLHALIGTAGHPDPPFAGRGCGLTWESWQSRTAQLLGIVPPQ